ncbi:MAG: GrpB family protein, partial [Pseudonocardiaceae bacterium]
RTLQQVEQLWLKRILPFRDNIVAHRPAGLPMELHPYDSQWPQRYRRAVTRLTTALSECLISLEHVGATAVPGSRSHDVVDIRAWVTDVADVTSRLERRGWFPIGVDWRVPRYASADTRDCAALFVHSVA